MIVDESVVYVVEHDFSNEYYNMEKDSTTDCSGDEEQLRREVNG
jgi:hypothetical protein